MNEDKVITLFRANSQPHLTQYIKPKNFQPTFLTKYNQKKKVFPINRLSLQLQEIKLLQQKQENQIIASLINQQKQQKTKAQSSESVLQDLQSQIQANQSSSNKYMITQANNKKYTIHQRKTIYTTKGTDVSFSEFTNFDELFEKEKGDNSELYDAILYSQDKQNKKQYQKYILSVHTEKGEELENEDDNILNTQIKQPLKPIQQGPIPIKTMKLPTAFLETDYKSPKLHDQKKATTTFNQNVSLSKNLITTSRPDVYSPKKMQYRNTNINFNSPVNSNALVQIKNITDLLELEKERNDQLINQFSNKKINQQMHNPLMSFQGQIATLDKFQNQTQRGYFNNEKIKEKIKQYNNNLFSSFHQNRKTKATSLHNYNSNDKKLEDYIKQQIKAKLGHTQNSIFLPQIIKQQSLNNIIELNN